MRGNYMDFEKVNDRLEKIFTIILFFLMVLSFFTNYGLVNAQDNNPPTADEINAVAKELYCPVCENVSLDVCPTQACAQWRGLIEEKLVAGWTKDEIKQYFVDQYGDRVLAEPPRRGFNWLVYVLPPLFFIAGIFVVYKNLRKVKKTDNGKQSSETIDDDEYLEKVEIALKSMNDNN
jgi:cytochrome c-type biogenesis protein CcmH